MQRDKYMMDDDEFPPLDRRGNPPVVTLGEVN